MAPATPLDPQALRRRCGPADIPVETTAEAAGLEEIVGQDRAVEARRTTGRVRRGGPSRPPRTSRAAIDAQVRRAGRIRERLLEEIRRGTVLIDTQGEQVGQVNGLSVLPLGEHVIGHPTRITARVRVGKGEVVDTVDDALERLTGLSAAEVNRRVEARLITFAEDARAFLGRPSTP